MKIGVFLDKIVDFSQADALSAAAGQINKWTDLGAEVHLLTAENRFVELKKIDDQLKAAGLVQPRLAKKKPDEKFLDLALAEKFDLVIEKAGAEQLPAVLPEDAGKLKKISVADVAAFGKLPEKPENLIPVE